MALKPDVPLLQVVLVQSQGANMFKKIISNFYIFAFGSFFLFNQGFCQEATENDLFEITKKTANTQFQANNNFYAFPLSEEEETLIKSFIDTLITNETISLFTMQNLLSYKDKLMCIHPVSMACFIYFNPTIYKKIKDILEDEIKSYFLILALEIQFNRIKQGGMLCEYISNIASITELNPITLFEVIEQKNYKGLIRILAQI